MSRRGRPAKPHALKVLDGDRADRINNDEPVPSAGAVEPPYKLTKDVAAVWARVAPDLIRKGVLTPWDVDEFAKYCELTVLVRRAMQSARAGILVKGSNRSKGERVYNRALQAVKELGQQHSALGARFGLNPSDRQRLKIESGTDDPAARYLT